MKAIPEVLAARAIHQYRRRDILAYVSLRLYLRNTAAIRDIWNDEIATNLTADQNSLYYNSVETFKEVDSKTGHPEFRTLHIPGPNQIMAETSLLAACAEAGGPFECPSSVFSYRLSKSASETGGVFHPYFIGFKERHKAIAAACRESPDAVVVYLDIRKYYPSISFELALRVWREAAEESSLDPSYKILGEKLLREPKKAEDTMGRKSGILTGPMLSHLIGNLVFRGIDKSMATELPGGYFRYVDDIAIVANPDRATEVEQQLRERLAQLDLSLNEDKRLETTAKAWLIGENDFDEQTGVSWRTFVGGMKRLLLYQPTQIERLKNRFEELDIRIRPIDYSGVEHERPFLERLTELSGLRWFRRIVHHRLTVDSVIAEALALRERYGTELDELLKEFKSLNGYARKRKIYRLRFLIARLTYLAPLKRLPEISNQIAGIPEMAMPLAVYHSITTRDVTQLLKYGPTAIQSAAQALRAGGDKVTCKEIDLSKEQISQAYAICRLNGLVVDNVVIEGQIDPIIQFCDWNDDSASLYREKNDYFRELGCLHGLDDRAANQWAIETAFDKDDGMVFDMQEIMQASSLLC